LQPTADLLFLRKGSSILSVAAPQGERIKSFEIDADTDRHENSTTRALLFRANEQWPAAPNPVRPEEARSAVSKGATLFLFMGRMPRFSAPPSTRSGQASRAV
jgi:hypothetical protein